MRVTDITHYIKIADLKSIFYIFVGALVGSLYRIMGNDTWLIAEYENMARDNGYWLYRYLCENKPNQKVYYAIKKDSADYQYVNDLGSIVEFGSLFHYILFFGCSKYVATNPIYSYPYKKFFGFMVKHHMYRFKYVFLNHGMARGYVSLLDRKAINCDLYIAASPKEAIVFKEVMHLTPSAIAPIGFCRFDTLTLEKVNPNLIVFMPTWRNWLDIRGEKTQNMDKFYTSDYYMAINSLIHSEPYVQFLEKNGLQMILYLHSFAQGYSELFESTTDCIRICTVDDCLVQELLKRASFLITDYSSVQFDYAYMHKPMVFYQYDAEMFSEKMYAESEYYQYERDGFGPVLQKEVQVIDYIVDRFEHSWEMEAKYGCRVEQYFGHQEYNHCERTYQLIQKL